MKKSVIDEAYEKAKETVRLCSTQYGLYASGGKKGYKGVWARDSMITLIGATSADDEFKHLFKKSILTLRKHQSHMGQIPNAVLKLKAKNPQVDFKSIDSSLWYVIGQYIYKKRFREAHLFDESEHSIKNAVKWVMYRDVGEDVTLEQLSTTDWQDAFPNKYGTVISTQALYCKVLELIKDKKRHEKLKREVNSYEDDDLWNGKFYWAYRWKNHNKYKEIGKWFDSFGNLIAIIFDLADDKKAKSIIDYIQKHNINRPYPVKSIFPSIKRGSEYWEDYYLDAGASPNHYLNGGIWPYLGGFYVLALIKMKQFKKAEKELKILAESNLKSHVFPEWIDPITKATYGVYQAWSAGTYMWAYNSLKSKKVLI